MNILDKFKTYFATDNKAPTNSIFGGVTVRDMNVLTLGATFNKSTVNSYLYQASNGDTRYLSALKREVLQEPFISGEYQKVLTKLLNSPFDVIPYPTNSMKPSQINSSESKQAQQVADFVKANILDPDLDIGKVIDVMLYGLMDGVSGLEIISEIIKGKEKIVALNPVPSERIRLMPNSMVLGIQLGEDASVLTPLDNPEVANHFVIMVADHNEINPARRGVLRKVLGAWLTKRYVSEWWNRNAELYGQPLRLAKYPAANEELRATLQKLLQEAGNSPYLVIPEQAQIEFVAGASTPSTDLHEKIIESCNQAISIAILGATQTTTIQKGAGSKASATVHEGVVLNRVEGYASEICAALRSQLIKKLVARNFGDDVAEEYCPILRINVAGYEDLESFSVAIQRLVDTGLPVGQSFVYEKTGIDMPVDEPLLIPVSNPSPAFQPPSQDPEVNQSIQFAAKKVNKKVIALEEQAIKAGMTAGMALIKPYLHILEDAKKDKADLGHVANRVRHEARFNGHTVEEASKVVQAVMIHAALTGYTEKK